MTAFAAEAATSAKLATVEQAVTDALSRGNNPAVLVKFKGKADLSAAFSIADRDARSTYVYQTLKNFADRAQAQTRQTLSRQYNLSEAAHEYTVLWIDNSIAISSLNSSLLSSLASSPEVASIRTQREIPLPVDEVVASTPELNAVVSSVTRIKAPDVWAMGFKGEGLVLANIDAGVRYTHAALVNQYRGNLGGGNFNHQFNWYDPYNHAAVPRYTDPHGSHTMGTMVGDNGSTEQIGVAPGAKWINCIGFGLAQAGATDAGLLGCGQFMLAPTDIAGTPASADPTKRPDVVNNSWGDCGRSFDNWYDGVIDGWIAAGIAPVFSNGNNSNCGYASNPPLNTVGNPARSGKVLGIGSTGNNNGQYANHSNKGPTDNPNPGGTAYPDAHGFANLKPNFSAPGVSIRSAMSSGDAVYGGMSGTSMSAPAVTGVIGLMWNAAPCLKGNYARTGSILMETAIGIPVSTGSPSDGPGNIPNQATGWGEVDALAAVNAARAICSAGGVVPPTVATSFAPASVAVSTNSVATITLANANATVATLTAALVDTLPTGLVASSAATTCGGTASFTAGSITLASGATIPAGSCTITANVQSATAGSYVNTIAAGALKTDKGNNAAAASATLTVTGGGSNPNLVCAAPDRTLVETFDGTSINWITGVIDDVGAQIHWNPYNAAESGPSLLAFFWPTAGGGGGAAVGGTYSVLQAGATVGASNTFIQDTGANSTSLANWRAGVDGYMGFKLTCPSGTCYGYAHLTTTGSNGFPAKLKDYCYDKSGATITIAGGGTPGNGPIANITPTTLSLSAAQGASATAPLTIGNTGDAALTYTITESLAARAAEATARSAKNASVEMGPVSFSRSSAAASDFVGRPLDLLATDISQMTNNVPVSPNGVGCGNATAGASDNSWWRRFYFNEHLNVTGPTATIKTVTVASESGANTPVTIKLYTIPHSTAVDTIPRAGLTLIGTGTGSVGGNLTTSTITIAPGAVVDDTVGKDLVVEYHIDAGAGLPRFFPGGNATAQTHKSFISSDNCTIPDPVTTDSIGFPDFHIIMVVNVDEGGTPPPVGCQNPSDVPWLSATPTSGTVAPGSNAAVTVSGNAGSMAVGSYTANICVATNDPAHAMTSVPVTLTVTSGGGGGDLVCSGPINHAIVNNFDGTYIKWEGGVISDTGNIPGANFNPWATGGKLAFFWPNSSTGNAGVAVSATGNDWKVLQAGDQVGPSQVYSQATAEAASWNAGADGYLGFKFGCSTAATCYGYAHMTAAGPTGFPATLVDYCYDKSGAAVTIGGGGGGGDPIADVTPAAGFDFTVDEGATGTDTMVVKNIGGGTLTYSIAESEVADRNPPSYKTAAAKRLSKLNPTGVDSSASFASSRSLGASGFGRPFVLQATDISQMADNTPGDEGVSCGVQSTSTADNSWWRRFYFSEHPQVGASTSVQSVTISTGGIAIGGGMPVTINLYTIPHSTAVDTIPTGSLTLIGTANATLNGALASVTVPVTGTVNDTVGQDLVVEYHTDGNASGGQFFPGANASAQTHPTFISSNECEIPDPTPTSGIGFSDFHLTMVVTLGDGTPPVGGCQSPSNIPWLSATPTTGSVAAGASSNVAVTVNATGMTAGTYEANLCVTTNDPTHALITVPVSMTVESSVVDGIFCDGFDGGDGSCNSSPGEFTQPLQDPSFEATQADAGNNPFWTGTDSNDPNGGTPFYSASGFDIDVRTGNWEVWFGGWRATAETQTFSQSVTIASGGPRFINYWRNVVATPEGTATLKVYVDGTAVETTDIVANGEDPGWVNKSVDISTYGDNASHTIKFEYVTAGSDDGNVFIDDVTIDAQAGSARRSR